MKQFLFSLLTIAFVGSSIAQTTYESPHVKEGKTIQFTIPEGYFFVDESDVAGDAMYVKKEGMDYRDVDPTEIDMGILMIMHEPNDETLQLQDYLNDLESALLEENKGLSIVEEPKIVSFNGREVLHGGFKGEMEEEKVDGLYFSSIRFGDYHIFVSYFAAGGVKDLLPYDEFIKIIASWKAVDTDKEDGIEALMNEDYSTYAEEDYSIHFPNDLFETEISYYDILPDFGGEWNDAIDQSGHLLSMFSYKENNGFIKVFSGGLASNYPSEEEMADAIERVTEWSGSMSIEFNTQFANEDHVFRLYTITDGGTMSSVYTTEVNKELVFFVVDGGSDPVDDFKPAVRDFMLTMWVDYFDPQDEDSHDNPRY
jgi:hypothetical protein